MMLQCDAACMHELDWGEGQALTAKRAAHDVDNEQIVADPTIIRQPSSLSMRGFLVPIDHYGAPDGIFPASHAVSRTKNASRLGSAMFSNARCSYGTCCCYFSNHCWPDVHHSS